MISSQEKCSRVDSSQKNLKSLNLYNNYVFAPQVKNITMYYIYGTKHRSIISFELPLLEYFNIFERKVEYIKAKVNKRENF